MDLCWQHLKCRVDHLSDHKILEALTQLMQRRAEPNLMHSSIAQDRTRAPKVASYILDRYQQRLASTVQLMLDRTRSSQEPDVLVDLLHGVRSRLRTVNHPKVSDLVDQLEAPCKMRLRAFKLKLRIFQILKRVADKYTNICTIGNKNLIMYEL